MYIYIQFSVAVSEHILISVKSNGKPYMVFRISIQSLNLFAVSMGGGILWFKQNRILILFQLGGTYLSKPKIDTRKPQITVYFVHHPCTGTFTVYILITTVKTVDSLFLSLFSKVSRKMSFSVILTLKDPNKVTCWLIDFNGISIRVRSFYAKKLRYKVHVHIFQFFLKRILHKYSYIIIIMSSCQHG